MKPSYSESNIADIKSSIQNLKFGHSTTLDYHADYIPKKLPPRSCFLSKLPSIPKIVVDDSVELAIETITRKSLQNSLLKLDPTVFRRKALPDSCAETVKQRHLMRSVMDTHPISDPKDIAPPKFGYNFSRKIREEPELRTSHEDFLRPSSPVLTRSTGYNKGHIRSILQLDTFGPDHHAKVVDLRSHGEVPPSPNIDRFEEESLHSTNRPGSGDSVASTRSSPSLLSRTSSGPRLQVQNFAVKPLTADIADVLLDGHITEKYTTDPHANSLKWYKKYKKSEEDKKKLREHARDTKAKMQKQEKEAHECRHLIEEFEEHLKSVNNY